MIYALDTNVIIQLINGNELVCGRRDTAIDNGNDIVIPPFADYEILRGFYFKPSPLNEKLYSEICEFYPVGVIDSKIWKCGARLYAELRNAGRSADDGDILIAAFCIENGYTLVTNNTKHFKNINGLLVENWQG